MARKKGQKGNGGTSVGRQTKRQKGAKDPELENEDLVGLRCEVWWGGELEFFTGEIADYNSVKGTFVIDYDDGDQDTGLEIQEFKIEGSARKKLVRILKYRADDKAYLVKAATPPAEASDGTAKGSERGDSYEEPLSDSAHHELGEKVEKLGGSGNNSAEKQQGAPADSVSCRSLQSRIKEVEEAKPAQEPACSSSRDTDSSASSESEASRKATEARTEGGKRDDTTEAIGQEASADLERVLNGAGPSAPEERRGRMEGGERQVVPESKSQLGVTPSTSLGGQGQPAPPSSSRKLDDKQQAAFRNQNWETRAPSNSTSVREPSNASATQKRKREDSEVSGLDADGSELSLRVGVCRWATVPVLSGEPGQPDDAPLMGRIASWPFPTLLPQVHAAAIGRDGCAYHNLQKPITLAPPASGRLPMQVERKKHRLADVSLPSSTVMQLQSSAQPPQLLSDAEQPAAYYPLPGTSMGRARKPTNDSDKVSLPTAEQIALVRQKAEAAAKAQSSRLSKLKQEQQSKRNSCSSRSRSRSRSRERGGRRSRDREASKAGRQDSREQEGRQSEQEKYEAIKRDAAARRRRESRGDSRDRPGSADGADDRGRKRSREPSCRGDGKEGKSGSRVIYLSDRQRGIPGNRPGSRSRTGTPLPPDRLEVPERDIRSEKHMCAQQNRIVHCRKPEDPKKWRRNGSRSRSRSRSRGRALHRRRSHSRSRDRGTRGTSTRSPDSQEAALRKDKAAAERHRSSKRSRSSSVALDTSNGHTDKSGSPDESTRDDASKADEREPELAPAKELLPPRRRFKRGRVFLCNSDELEACIRKRVAGGSRPSDREEVCVHTAIFFFDTTMDQLAGIFCGEDQAPSKLCSSGPFRYQTQIRVWRHGARVSAAAAKDAVGPHPNRNSRCPIPELLSEKQVRALCYEFKRAVS